MLENRDYVSSQTVQAHKITLISYDSLYNSTFVWCFSAPRSLLFRDVFSSLCCSGSYAALITAVLELFKTLPSSQELPLFSVALPSSLSLR